MPQKIINITIRHTGETGKIESEALKFITPEMTGLDIGSGGCPIIPQAISIDYLYPGIYSNFINIKGDAKTLTWFTDNCLDYIFSSHCFEDFSIIDKPRVFKEWLRVLKPKGKLILYLPDEQEYQDYCRKHNGVPNKAHTDPTFSIKTIRYIASFYLNICKEIYAIEKHGDYCFFIVYEKE